MGQYVQRRLIQMLPLLIGISLVIFAIIQAAPGGPEAMLYETGRFISPDLIEAYRPRLGVDKPVHVHYYLWITSALKGDFGLSLQLLFSVRLGWLPVAGTQTVGATSPYYWADHCRYYIGCWKCHYC